MYAVIRAGGKQYRVAPGDVVNIEKLPAGNGDTVEFNDVLAVSSQEGTIGPGAGAVVSGQVMDQGRAGKILVFPSAKGSSGWAGFFQTTRLSGTAPIGMIIGRLSAKSALGAVVTRVPAVTDLDADPCSVIETGDWVLLDNSTVEVTKK